MSLLVVAVVVLVEDVEDDVHAKLVFFTAVRIHVSYYNKICRGAWRYFGAGFRFPLFRTQLFSAIAAESSISPFPVAPNARTSASPPTPADIPIADILDDKADFRLVRTTDVLRDVAQSETAPNWIVLVLCQGKDQMFISVPGTNGDPSLFERLIGRHASAVGEHVSAILRKIGAANRAEAVAIALRKHLLEI